MAEKGHVQFPCNSRNLQSCKIQHLHKYSSVKTEICGCRLLICGSQSADALADMEPLCSDNRTTAFVLIHFCRDLKQDDKLLDSQSFNSANTIVTSGHPSIYNLTCLTLSWGPAGARPSRHTVARSYTMSLVSFNMLGTMIGNQKTWRKPTGTWQEKKKDFKSNLDNLNIKQYSKLWKEVGQIFYHIQYK